MEATERYNVETRETVKIEIEAFVDLRMIFHFFPFTSCLFMCLYCFLLFKIKINIYVLCELKSQKKNISLSKDG